MKDPHRQQRRGIDPNGFVGRRMLCHGEKVTVLEPTSEPMDFWVRGKGGRRFITSALRRLSVLAFVASWLILSGCTDEKAEGRRQK